MRNGGGGFAEFLRLNFPCSEHDFSNKKAFNSAQDDEKDDAR